MSGYTLHDVAGAVLTSVDCPVDAHRLLRTLDDAVVWRLPTGEVGGTKIAPRSRQPFQLRRLSR